MKRFRVILLLLVLAWALVSLRPVKGQSGFIISNADATNTLTFNNSVELGGILEQLAPRFVIQFANTKRVVTFAPIPIRLNDALAAIHPRFVIDFANANKFYTLMPLPDQLRTLTGLILPRTVIDHANADRFISLNFPAGIIQDTTPPQIINITTHPVGMNSTKISWTTNEYADSTVQCGTQPGVYTVNLSNSLFILQHTATLTDLTTEATYYCVCRSSDQSGNTSQSYEFHFKQNVQALIYLPLVLQSH